MQHSKPKQKKGATESHDMNRSHVYIVSKFGVFYYYYFIHLFILIVLSVLLSALYKDAV